jgi:hypothetical protein
MKDLTKAELITHEQRVAAFMVEARAADPDRVSLVESKYPVLSARQMRTRRDAESPLDLVPIATNARGVCIGQVPRTYSRRSNENRRNPHPAD